MQYSNDPNVEKYLSYGVENQLPNFHFDGVHIKRMHRFYDFLKSAGAEGPFDKQLLDLIEAYIEAEPGKYDYKFNDHRIPFELDDYVDSIDHLESIIITF